MNQKAKATGDFSSPVADQIGKASVTWTELLDHCSRIHTTRSRPVIPWEPDSEQREDSHMVAALIAGSPGRIVPTRMHEPGFYFWLDGAGGPHRGEADMAWLCRRVGEGKVRITACERCQTTSTQEKTNTSSTSGSAS